MPFRRSIAAVLLLINADHIEAKSLPHFSIWIQSQDDGRCLLTTKGQTFDMTDKAALDAALSSDENPRPPVHLLGDTDTPYRCTGGLIYALQRKGYNKIGFISEKPASDAAKDDR
ncbi:hypothetical protein [Sphingobium sp.]|uniref:ExbD/TolR family protein n=1 Tax=Sphingobium sp. TaxID=1912891 RepID=UPI0026112AE0|nr:hypothetical protein [Sphingobium sp.]